MLPAPYFGRGGALLPQPKTGHGQEPEAETIAELVAATFARLYGKPADCFSWTYIASQAQTTSPQQVGRLRMRILDRTKYGAISFLGTQPFGYNFFPPSGVTVVFS